MTIATTFAIAANGNITEAAGSFIPGTSARFTTLELHAWLQDLADDAGPTGDDNLSILNVNPSTLAGKRNASRPMALTLNTPSNITDAVMQWFKFGSIEQGSGASYKLYTGLKVLGSLVANSPIYITQNSAKITKYWADSDAADFQILVKAKTGSTLIDSGDIVVFCRKYGQTYSHFDVNLAAGGEQVAALSTLVDTNITLSAAAAETIYNTITITLGDTSQDIGDGGGAQPYKGTITLDGSTSVEDAYQALQWACSESSTATPGSVDGWRYRVLPGQAYTEIIPAPFGTFAGGKWFVAQGWWVTGVPLADTLNYELIDHNGVIRAAPPPPAGLTINDLVAGSTVRVFETGTTTIIDSTTNSGTSLTVTGIVTDVDYTIQKDGYIPIRVVGQAVSGVTVVAGTQTVDRAYQA